MRIWVLSAIWTRPCDSGGYIPIKALLHEPTQEEVTNLFEAWARSNDVKLPEHPDADVDYVPNVKELVAD